jgi:hypothetical protein
MLPNDQVHLTVSNLKIIATLTSFCLVAGGMAGLEKSAAQCDSAGVKCHFAPLQSNGENWCGALNPVMVKVKV